MPTKTLIIYNDIESPMRFILVEGDYFHFHGVCVGSNGTGREEEFCDWFFDDGGKFKFQGQMTEDKKLLEEKQWDKVAICTFLP
ncbi:MAG: hypothetical protein BWY47_01530 [Bacteroidetes bacterium ADurb.Bin302]|nr:MAG: hypothetical protein BWY47_01530 [Bacteroidetes bacterium ADurb.Bin302]